MEKTFDQSTDALGTYNGKRRSYCVTPKPKMSLKWNVWRKCEILNFENAFEKTRLELKTSDGQIIQARCDDETWIPNIKLGLVLNFKINIFEVTTDVYFNEIIEWIKI